MQKTKILVIQRHEYGETRDTKTIIQGYKWPNTIITKMQAILRLEYNDTSDSETRIQGYKSNLK